MRLTLHVGPFGPSELRLHAVRGREALNELYRFELAVETALDDLVFERLVLGQRATVTLDAAGHVRWFHGIIARVEVESSRADHRAMIGVPEHTNHIRLEMVPRAWLLERRKTSRVFNRMRVDQIIAAVCGDAAVRIRNLAPRGVELPVREMVTQYEETDWEFVKRLAAENALSFYFEHPVDLRTRVPLDIPSPAVALPPAEQARWGTELLRHLLLREEVFVLQSEAQPPRLGELDAEDMIEAVLEGIVEELHYVERNAPVDGDARAVFNVRAERNLRSTRARYSEFDPDRPTTPHESDLTLPVNPALLADVARIADAGIGGREHVDATGEGPELELYEHQGSDLYPDWAWTRGTPRRVLDEERRRTRLLWADSALPLLAPGHGFFLSGYPSLHRNGPMMVVEVAHEAGQPPQQERRREGREGTGYRNSFSCVPQGTAYPAERPERRCVQVALTATVVGPAGETVHTDAMGRIKVRFHWERGGNADGTNSCWVRTMQSVAGTGWGSQFIPRIGMEVVVIFENGDPDRPLVIGCVQNQVSPAPFALPSRRAVCGFKTMSFAGGGGNELSFDDSAAAERLVVHAHKDLVVRANDARTTLVAGDDQEEIRGNHQRSVQGKLTSKTSKDEERFIGGRARLDVMGDRETSAGGHERTSIGKGRATTVAHDDETAIGGTANVVVGRDHFLKVVGSMATVVGGSEEPQAHTLHVEGTSQFSARGVTVVSSDERIELRVGRSSIRITDEGIQLSAPRVQIAGDGARILLAEESMKVKVKQKTQVVSDRIILKSAGASLGMSREFSADGAKVLLNSPEQACDSVAVDESPVTRIRVVDDAGKPIPFQRFRVEMKDGSVETGFVGEDGEAVLEIENPGRIVFPDLVDVEGS